MGLYAQVWTQTRGSRTRGVLMQRNEGEPCRLWTLHQPWLRELLASSLQAGLRETPPLGPRREPEAYHKTGRRRETPQQGEASREAETPPQEGTRGHEPLLRKREGEVDEQLNPRRCHQRTGVNTMRRRGEARTTANADVGEALRQNEREVAGTKGPE